MPRLPKRLTLPMLIMTGLWLTGCASREVGLAVALPEPQKPQIPEVVKAWKAPEFSFLKELSRILVISQPAPTS